MTAPTKQAPAAAPKARPFRSGVQAHQEPTTTITGVPSTSPIPWQYDIPSYGFLIELYLRITVTGGVGSGTAAVYRADAPFSWIQTIQFLDVNSTPIIFQITGHDLYLLNKYGGFKYSSDAKQGWLYSQGGIGGNSVFTLRIPIQIRSRDCLGALPNKNNATAYKILGAFAPLTDVFSTNPAPTTPTLISMQVVMSAWWEPEATDLRGRPQAQVPPGNNTTMYTAKQVFTHSGGSVTHQIKRLGYLYRNLILVQRDQGAPPARSDTILPDPMTVIYEGQNLTILPRDLLRHRMVEDYGYTAGLDAAGGVDTGVYVLPYTTDFGLQPGDECANGYLPTTSASRVELQGSAGAAGTLGILINDVAARDDAQIAAS